MNAISFAKVKRRIRSGVFAKTDSGDDGKGSAQDYPANSFGYWQGPAGNGSKNFARSGGRNHRAAGPRWNGGEKGRPACKDQTRFVQGARRTAGSRDQRGEGDESATKSDDDENRAGLQTSRGPV